ncbi:plasmid mobilization protein [Rhodobacter sp. 24-YEA-8]|uniref:plasmid mobilization protein n=1 Tax=Rhodobacter sp. 24-YEA-8 TaxID=1884310 RepID=UPI000896CF0F|nr:plasmid mobilization relaxosome protein MobC [Rhodobacter sp. 24-YEA-8]SEB50576.1 mobilisation protein (MobC) [Rhodobacter sp. 24-YEA-8]
MVARPHRIEFRAAPEEWRSVNEKAKRIGMPVATYARHSALMQPMPEQSTRIDAEAVAALNRLGGNLNQIAKSANGRGLTPQQVQALAILGRKINDTVNSLKGLMK